MFFLWQHLHLAGWLYDHGYYGQSARELRYLLHAEQSHPHIVALIHRVMYSINPDWGL